MNNAYLKLDELAAPDSYVAVPSAGDMAYQVHFRKVCQQYHIEFANADEDERAFVIHMAEREFYPKQA